MFDDACLGGRRLDGLRAPDTMQEAGGRKAVQRLADVELAEPRFVHEPGDVAPAVNETDERLLLHRQLRTALLEPSAIELEHDVEARNLLLDEAPLIHPARPLEEERLGIDRHDEILLVRLDVGLEVERPLVPREQVEDGFLDLQLDVAMQLLARDELSLHEDLAQPLVTLRVLVVDGFVELRLRDQPILHENVAEPITA